MNADTSDLTISSGGFAMRLKKTRKIPVVKINCFNAKPARSLITEEFDKQFMPKPGRRPGLQIFWLLLNRSHSLQGKVFYESSGALSRFPILGPFLINASSHLNDVVET